LFGQSDVPATAPSLSTSRPCPANAGIRGWNAHGGGATAAIDDLLYRDGQRPLVVVALGDKDVDKKKAAAVIGEKIGCANGERELILLFSGLGARNDAFGKRSFQEYRAIPYEV
jgi:hypothetical protein